MRAGLTFVYADVARRAAPFVAASDASGAEEHDGADGFPGAYCLAVAAPSYAEIEATIAATETVGRRLIQPGQPGDASHRLATLPDVPLLARTIIPAHWRDGTVEWKSFLARRWRFEVEISRGELRTSVLWARIAAASGQVRRRELLLLGDNQSTTGTLARGRSGHVDRNAQMRILAVHEAFADFRLRAAWVLTAKEPADAGTRPDAQGRLRLGTIWWKARNRVIVVNDGSLSLWEHLRGSGHAAVQRWEWPCGPGGVGRRRGWLRRLMRELEGGYVRLLVWLVRAPRTGDWDGSASIDEIDEPAASARAAQLAQGCGSEALVVWNRALGEMPGKEPGPTLPSCGHDGHRGDWVRVCFPVFCIPCERLRSEAAPAPTTTDGSPTDGHHYQAKLNNTAVPPSGDGVRTASGISRHRIDYDITNTLRPHHSRVLLKINIPPSVDTNVNGQRSTIGYVVHIMCLATSGWLQADARRRHNRTNEGTPIEGRPGRQPPVPRHVVDDVVALVGMVRAQPPFVEQGA